MHSTIICKNLLMRIFYTILILCCLFSANAQIIEIPSESNYLIINEYNKKRKAKLSKEEQFQKRYNIQKESVRALIEQDLLVVFSGESNIVCPELEPEDSISFVNCSNLNFGTATLEDDCLTFTADSGIDLGMDTVCVQICDPMMVCDTLQYPVLIKRQNGIQLEDQIVLDAEADIILCADTTLFEGNFQSGQIIGCDIDDFGTTVSVASNCLQYFAGTYSELDTVCFLICDQFSICDTFVYPFLIAQDTIGLPFFDDFFYEGPYPDSDLWITNDVFVNNTLGINPPSIGMATFDGLSAGGTPYGNTEFRDFLVSTYLDLSTFNADSDVYLSFFIQPKGCGDKPEEDDLFILEFKDAQGVWDTIANFANETIFGINKPTNFDHQAIKIEQDKYFHGGFQFRFKNIGTGGGVSDLWHLDYVKLNSNESPDPTSPDIAFVNQASSILKNYNSMPWHQFKGFEAQELNGQMDISLFNHFGFIETAEPSSVSIVEQTTGITVLAESELLKLIGTINQKDVPSDILVQYTNPFPSFSGNINNAAFDNQSELIFQTIYKFDQNEEGSLTAGNNQTIRKTVFKNYFAYDDGTAESNLAAQGANTQAAIKYTTNVADSLRGVQIHFPHVFSDVSSQSFNLKIWIGDLDSDPVYQRNLIRPFYVDNVFDTLQGFTSYKFQDFNGNVESVFIPPGDFYIGWQQLDDEFESAIPIGLDLNSPLNEQKIFQNIGGGWTPVQDRFQGALMLRPIVGTEPAIETQVIELEPSFEEVFHLYPNPTSGDIEMILKDRDINNYTLRIYSIEGILKMINNTAQKITTLDLEIGYYIVSLSAKDGSETLIKKLIISK